MPAIVYPNTTNSASFNHDLSAEEKHPLQLCDQDRIDITQQFIRQISTSCLSSRAYRIMLAIFSQTLDFNKLEDDMNGKRLQQLTGIYPHHANATVRELEAMKAIITRKGRYGKYMSINFDFAQWGKGDCEKYPNNDPYFLLSDQEQEAQQDDNEPVETPITEMVETADEKAVIPQQAEQPAPIDRDYFNDLLQQILQTLETLTQRVERLEEAQKQRLRDDKKPPSATSNEEQEAKQITEQTIEKTRMANNVAETHHAPQIITENATETAPLRFPSQLSQAQCDSATKLLATADDQAQVLLDMLAKRLLNTDNPVRNPIAYLNNLLNRLKNNKFDKPCASIHTSTAMDVSATSAPTIPSPKLNDQLAEHRAEYREAAADCHYMKNNIERMAEQDNLSFDECLQKLELQTWWESLKERFYQAKAALTAIQPSELAQATG